MTLVLQILLTMIKDLGKESVENLSEIPRAAFAALESQNRQSTKQVVEMATAVNRSRFISKFDCKKVKNILCSAKDGEPKEEADEVRNVSDVQFLIAELLK